MITSRTCDKEDPNIILWIIHFTLSTYNVVNSVTYMYFALIFKLGETLGGGGGRGGLRYFHTFICIWLWPFLGVQKKEYFWGYEEFVNIFGWSLHMTNWTNLGDHFYIIWEFLIFLIFYYVSSRCWVQAYVCRVTPPPTWAETTHGRNDPPK